MKRIKKLLAILIILSTTFILTGCGNKKVITVEKFTEYMKGKDFETTDIIKNLGYEVTGVNSSIFAENKREESVITYMIFNSEEIAQDYYNQTTTELDEDAEQRYDADVDKFETKRIDGSNYKKYIQNTAFGQKVVSLVGNTVMQGETTGNKKLLSNHFVDLGY